MPVFCFVFKQSIRETNKTFYRVARTVVCKENKARCWQKKFISIFRLLSGGGESDNAHLYSDHSVKLDLN